MCSVHEWVHILVLLLVNPVSMMSLTPALLLLAACFLAYSVALVVVICHVRHILTALDFIVKWGLPYFMRDPIRASVYFDSLLLVLAFWALLTLWSKAHAAAAALLVRCATILRSSSPLCVFGFWRLAYGFLHPYYMPGVTLFLCVLLPVTMSGRIHLGDHCHIDCFCLGSVLAKCWVRAVVVCACAVPLRDVVAIIWSRVARDSRGCLWLTCKA